VVDARRSLTAADLPQRLLRLGFRPPDLADAVSVAHAAVSAGDSRTVDHLVARLRPGIGDLDGRVDLDPWAVPEAYADGYTRGVLPMLALIVSADEVVAWQRSRGIPADVGWAALADLGQQVWVHRQTYGSFGLHTEGWLRLVWSGALYWLGRLQFNLQRDHPHHPDEWVLSTHIPETGPLSPETVDASLSCAARFFARHFADYPTTDFHCCSWLLDPQLIAGLPAASNLAQFGRRWRLYGEPMPGNADALFFTFHRRGQVDLESLPRDTTLQRLIIDHLRAGQSWHLWHGRCPQPAPERLSS
jgi:GNAT-like C-terminal domain/N-acyltransferase N-terminal domain